jgi:glycosyltransferase involved in cell wall biosynthesis
MSNLLMEASAAAVPVVATRCGASDEVLEHGLTGYVVAQDDDAEFARCVDRLVSHPPAARQMGAAGRAKMRREFSIEAMVGRMADVYEEELARNA